MDKRKCDKIIGNLLAIQRNIDTYDLQESVVANQEYRDFFVVRTHLKICFDRL